jgi:hypothetical protein
MVEVEQIAFDNNGKQIKIVRIYTSLTDDGEKKTYVIESENDGFVIQEAYNELIFNELYGNLTWTTP